MEHPRSAASEPPLWTPAEADVAASAMEAFRRAAERAAGVSLPDYWALLAWSVAQPEPFWGLLATELRLPFSERGAAVRSAAPMPRTRWFEGSRLNYAEALLWPSGVAPADTAVVALTEGAEPTRLTWAGLREAVAAARSALLAARVGEGDVVAVFGANLPEVVTVLLASASIGAVFTSCSPDFGAEAATARFEQVAPRALFASGAYRYGGKLYDTSPTVAALRAGLPSLELVVELVYPGEGPTLRDVVTWDEWLRPHAGAELTFASLPFDHPGFVVYSSGTTGRPKSLVHRAGGVLLTHRKEHALHSGIRRGDVVYYFTTTGWMMWNWLVSALASGATIVLYDGSPAWPDPLATWRMAERLGVTFFGTSARFIQDAAHLGVQPGRDCDLGALRTVASTGSPLSPRGFEYVYSAVKRDVHLASISGGTDIVSCFMLGVPTLPVYPGEIQAPGLGVDLRVVDGDGHEVSGGPGELVCAAPLPSMPLRLVGDPLFERYEAAYFSDYPGWWRHGDLVERTAHGGVVVYGRSDATLNPGGVRIGTAEIYRPLEAVPEVAEAVAVARRLEYDQEVWLLVTLRPGAVLDAALEARIRGAIRSATSPRHVPKRIIAASGLPRTRSGKVMELAVANLVNGSSVPNRDMVANPGALDDIERRLRELGLTP